MSVVIPSEVGHPGRRVPSRTVTTPARRSPTASTASSPSRSKDVPSKLEQASPIPEPFDQHVAQSLDNPRHHAVDVNADTGGVDPTQTDAKRFHRFYRYHRIGKGRLSQLTRVRMRSSVALKLPERTQMGNIGRLALTGVDKGNVAWLD
jgi:hypothetical protein